MNIVVSNNERCLLEKGLGIGFPIKVRGSNPFGIYRGNRGFSYQSALRVFRLLKNVLEIDDVSRKSYRPTFFKELLNYSIFILSELYF